MAIEVLDDSNYRQVLSRRGVDRGSNTKAILVECAAPWSNSCQVMEPVLHRAQKKWGDKIDVLKFNVDNSDSNKDTKLELQIQGVMPRSLPTLLLFHDGRAIADCKGVITDTQLDDFLEGNLPIEAMYKLHKNGTSIAPRTR